MSHNDVLNSFSMLFSYHYMCMETWYPCGKNAIRIIFNDSEPGMVFTYNSETDWKYETMDSFVRSM